MLISSSQIWATETNSSLKLFFQHPGDDWENESLPLGNGKIGATILGHVVEETIQFNEKTLWTGGPHSSKGDGYGFPPYSTKDYLSRLTTIQQEINIKDSMPPKQVAEVLGNDLKNYGSYQSFGYLHLNFDASHANYTEYTRQLDLNTAIASVSYLVNDIRYLREYFVSYPDNSLLVKISADKAGSINFAAHISVPKNRTRQTQFLHKTELLTSGKLTDNKQQYAAVLKITHENGIVKQEDDRFVVNNADSVVLQLSASTNYELRHPNYIGTDAVNRTKSNINASKNLSYAQFKDRHLSDYQTLFSRVTFELNQTSPVAMDKMVAGYPFEDAKLNQSLERIYYQYGRYLLIASSRAGSLPANLQGIWNQDIQAPWSADYHLNINLQMNYWLADMTNLPETLPPLFDYLDNLTIPGKQAAEQLFNSPGWVVFLNSNPWGSIGLIKWPTAFWQPEAAAWMANQYFDHYLFTLDKTFLAEKAYPILKDASEFWIQNLVPHPETKLLTINPSYSPENGNFSAGAAMSQQIIFDLFMKTFASAQVLNDVQMLNKLSAALEKLDMGLKIGSWGQLQEWSQDWDKEDNKHRHVSHLYALHPGSYISKNNTPELAKAVTISLNARGDGGTGWSKAWKINFWARLLDGNRAYKLLQEQLHTSTLANLWSSHPPFQIDGNFGAVSGMTEMLLQSHQNTIHLLPALPQAWSNGQIQGLKARGNVQVAMQWHNNALQKAHITPMQNSEIKLKNSDFTGALKVISNGKNIPFKINNKHEISFSTLANQEYLVLVNQLSPTAKVSTLPKASLK
jgi:alpha-L-fucosidase 2